MRQAGQFILCFVTDRQSLRRTRSETVAPAASHNLETALLQSIESAARAGVDWVQIREKDLPARRLAALTRATIEACKRDREERGNKPSPRVLVNDRFDVAWPAGAGGVHAGEASAPIGALVEARREAGLGNFLVGASCHSLEAARRAAAESADYIFFGPVFPTPSKASFGAPQGLAKLAEVCLATEIPVIAIGGVTVENAGFCAEAGAAGIAAIRLFQQSPDPAEIVARLRGR